MRPPEELIEAYFDEELTPEEAEELRKWLSASRRNLRYFAREAHLHQALHQFAAADAWLNAGRQGRQTPILRLPEAASQSSALRPWWLGIAGLAAGLLFVMVSLRKDPGAESIILLAGDAPGIFWRHNGLEKPAAGDITLVSGDSVRTDPSTTALIGYAHDKTRLELAGGSQVTLGSASPSKDLQLDYGVLHASVAKQAAGRFLQFRTVDAIVQILGTELRLSQQQGRTELEVYSGQTRMTHALRPDTVLVASGERGIAQRDQPLVRGTVPVPTGHVALERWLQQPESSLAEWRTTRRSSTPSDSQVLQPSLEIPENQTEHFVARLSGWLYPPQTGDYRFWVSADDQGELWLGSNETMGSKRLLCGTTTFVSPEDWTKAPSQQSRPVRLVQGRRYYIEGLLRQAGGAASFAVAWEGPGFPRQKIPARYLSEIAPESR